MKKVRETLRVEVEDGGVTEEEDDQRDEVWGLRFTWNEWKSRERRFMG